MRPLLVLLFVWVLKSCATAAGAVSDYETLTIPEMIEKMSSWRESASNWSFTVFVDQRTPKEHGAQPGTRLVCAMKNVTKVARMLIVVGVEGRYEFLWEGATPEYRNKEHWVRTGGSRMRSPLRVGSGGVENDVVRLEDYFILVPGRRYSLRVKCILEHYTPKGVPRPGVISNLVTFTAKEIDTLRPRD